MKPTQKQIAIYFSLNQKTLSNWKKTEKGLLMLKALTDYYVSVHIVL